MTTPPPDVPAPLRKAAARTLRDHFGLSLAQAHNLIDGRDVEVGTAKRALIDVVLTGYVAGEGEAWLRAVAVLVERAAGWPTEVQSAPAIAEFLAALTVKGAAGDGRHLVIAGSRLEGDAWVAGPEGHQQRLARPSTNLYSPDPAKSAERLIVYAEHAAVTDAERVVAAAIEEALDLDPPRTLDGQVVPTTVRPTAGTVTVTDRTGRAVAYTLATSRVTVTVADSSVSMTVPDSADATHAVAMEVRRAVNAAELARVYDGWPHPWPDGREYVPAGWTGWIEPGDGSDAVWVGDIDIARWLRTADEDTEQSSCCFAQVTYGDSGLYCKRCYHDVEWATPDGMQHGQPPFVVELSLDDIQHAAEVHGTCQHEGCERDAVIIAPETAWDEDAGAWMPVGPVRYLCVEHGTD